MKTAVFIDGGALHKTSRVMGLDTDFAKLKKHHGGEDTAGHVTFRFFGMVVVGDDGMSPMTKLIDWLDYNGFRVHEVLIDPEGQSDRMGEMIRNRRPEIIGMMTADMIDAAMAGLDHAIIYSGDGALVHAVSIMQRMGVRVTVAFDKESCADELRRKTDGFVELSKLAEIGVLKPAKVRAA
jgi:uncharacterized LabA/DUF88 family protein